MLDVTQTSIPGIGLSIPQVAERSATPYLCMKARGPMRELPTFAPPLFDKLHGWMRERGFSGREGFFRYRRFHDNGDVEMEVGTTTAGHEKGGGDIVADELPAGRYAVATCVGPYDRLFDATAMLNGWISARGLKPATDQNGEGIGCQIEIYRVSPADHADPLKYETDILILLA